MNVLHLLTFFFSGCTHSTQKFLGQRLNLCHSCGKARSLTCCDTRELPYYPGSGDLIIHLTWAVPNTYFLEASDIAGVNPWVSTSYVQRLTWATLGQSRSQHLRPDGWPAAGCCSLAGTGAHLFLRHCSPHWWASGTTKFALLGTRMFPSSRIPMLFLSPRATIHGPSQSWPLFFSKEVATPCPNLVLSQFPSTHLLWQVLEGPPSLPWSPSECSRSMLLWIVCGRALHWVWLRAGGHRTLLFLDTHTLTPSPTKPLGQLHLYFHSFRFLPEDYRGFNCAIFILKNKNNPQTKYSQLVPFHWQWRQLPTQTILFHHLLHQNSKKRNAFWRPFKSKYTTSHINSLDTVPLK